MGRKRALLGGSAGSCVIIPSSRPLPFLSRWAVGRFSPPPRRLGARRSIAEASSTRPPLIRETNRPVVEQNQLAAAVASEDFAEAEKLKRTMSSVRDNDPVTKIERAFRRALKTEDYKAAAKYRDAGAGLTGWWCGRGDTEDEPGGAYGVMMQVTAQHGRYVGTSYSARDLAMVQEASRQARRGGRKSKSRKGGPDRTGEDDDPMTGWDQSGDVGHRVFELWVEEDEDGTVRHRAVRLDAVPTGAALNAADAEGGFVSSMGGFAVDQSGVVVEERAAERPPARGFINNPEHPAARSSGATSADGAMGDLTGAANRGAAAFGVPGDASVFASWQVRDGRVSAPEMKNGVSPFPFDVDGISMEELLSYEAQGFMADFKRMPGFEANWARLKAQHRGELSETEGFEAERAVDEDVFEAFGGVYKRGGEGGSDDKPSREPHDDFFFEKYVINETADDSDVIDLDDFEGLLEGEDMDDYEDEDALDAAAMAMLSGRRLDALPKGLPAAVLAEIQSTMGGLEGAEYVELEEDDDSPEEELGADGGDWMFEEVRVPAEMTMNGRHGFQLASDEEDFDHLSGISEEEGEEQPLLSLVDGSEAVRGSLFAGVPSPLAAAAAARATSAEVEAAVLRGLADAKARVAEELRAAANQAAIERGESELVMVNLDDQPDEDDHDAAGTTDEEADEEAGDDTSAASSALSQGDAPFVSSDGVASRLGGTASRLRASLDAEIDRFLADKWETTPAGPGAREASPRGTTSDVSDAAHTLDAASAAYASAQRRLSRARDASAAAAPEVDSSSGNGEAPDSSGDEADADAAEALMELLAQDGSGGMPLPLHSRFTRIPPQVASRESADPFDRLYLGAFGPHGPEVLRLVRGRWGDELGEGEECVTAVKLTGDSNVPAGAASFRAKVSPESKLDSTFSYPEELGVVARYAGQGRVAKPGFTERNWVEGELLLLDGRGGSLTGGAELGFVWAVPGERRLLILFSSLELPDATPPVGMYLD